VFCGFIHNAYRPHNCFNIKHKKCKFLYDLDNVTSFSVFYKQKFINKNNIIFIFYKQKLFINNL